MTQAAMIMFTGVGNQTQEDVDIENLKALIRGYQGEVKYLKAELASARGERDRALAQALISLKKLHAAKATAVEDAEIAGYFRDHLSESEPGDGNEYEEKARQIMWNEEDAKAEGIEE